MALDELRVIDFHAHFPTKRWFKWSASWRKRLAKKYGVENAQLLIEQSIRDKEKMRKLWGFAPPETETLSDEEQAARWAEDLDVKGIKRVNFVTGGGNDNLSETVKLHPKKFSGFAHHHIFSDNASSELERAVKQLGLRGYKVIAPALAKSINHKSIYPVWEKAEKLEIPIIIHFGVLGGGGGPSFDLENMNPLSLWEVAKMFPRIPFVIPHFGAGYLRELLLLCWSCPNVYMDTSGSNRWMHWMPFEIDLKGVFRKAIETVGPDRIIFGSDSSYFPRGFTVQYLMEQVKACQAIGLEKDGIDKIFYKNAATLLKLKE
ncbi:MAG: amidohydrolase family protein [Candidatus Bathyarchaeota archaeon]|nr:MAG: amidohydrolase family protein [Candidatus Bathyarchaeota archaeon]